MGAKNKNGWKPAYSPPEEYDIVLLRFEDGTTGRGTWNGKLWWGYDVRVHCSRELHPISWRQWESPAPDLVDASRRTP